MYVRYGPAVALQLDLRADEPRKVLRILAAAKDGPDAPRICQPAGQLTHTALSSAAATVSDEYSGSRYLPAPPPLRAAAF